MDAKEKHRIANREYKMRLKLGLPLLRKREPPKSAFVRSPEVQAKHCKRCDILFEYGGPGDGVWCDDCLDEEGIVNINHGS